VNTFGYLSTPLFSGVGKLKNFQLRIPIDETVEPVIQPIRRIPYHLREKLDRNFNELVDLDIIEPVDGLSQWISPVVVIPKKNEDMRLFVDMRRTNQAVTRERYVSALVYLPIFYRALPL
jgi:hypothetical protein